MTDNEKRAHDIAIATIPILYDLHKANVSANPDMTEQDKAFDVYHKYVELLNITLELVNRDFKA